MAGKIGERLSAALLALVAISFAVGSEPAVAQESFYKGKVIRLIVRYSAGGGFDTYSQRMVRAQAGAGGASPWEPAF